MPRAVSNEERLRWQDDNGDLVGFLSTVTADESSHFVRSMQRRVLDVGVLTDGQTRVLRTIMEERQTRPAPTDARGVGTADQYAHMPAPTVALTDDLPEIRNGVYTINDGGEHITYRIHTVQRGSLQGKRIIKRQTSYGEFEGFGFLRTDGTLQVWRRFAQYEAGNARYVVWAKHLLAALVASGEWTPGYNRLIWRVSIAPTLDDRPGDPAFTEYEIQRTVHCRRCNRPLTTPSSIDGGIGPECAGRDYNRTVAADPRAEVADDLVVNLEFENNAESWTATSGQNLNINISREPRTGRRLPWTTFGPMRERPATELCIAGDVYVLNDPHNSNRPNNNIHVFDGHRWRTMPMTFVGLSEAAAICGQSMQTLTERIAQLQPSLQAMIINAISEADPYQPGERGPAGAPHQPGERTTVPPPPRRPRIRNTPNTPQPTVRMSEIEGSDWEQ